MKTKWVVTRVEGESEVDFETKFDTEDDACTFAGLMAAHNPGPVFYTVSEVEVPYDAV